MSKWLNLFLENKIVNRGDKSDRFKSEPNMSPLSLRPRGLLDKKLKKVENNYRNGGDKSDRFRFEANKLGPSLRENFEERLAIAEYDGQQTSRQAQRIAYLDAFMAVLSTLPYEEEEGHYDEDWLTRRVKSTKECLAGQRIRQPE